MTRLAASTAPLQIHPLSTVRLAGVWALLEPVFRAGGTFPHDPAITEAQARTAWLERSRALRVAVDAGGALVGTHDLRPNALALGAHGANAGDVVAERCRRQGIGGRLCQHSLQAARRLGCRLMPFNLVVSTNTAGLRCWQRNGFEVVGSLPGAFRHRRLGHVDALVMVRSPEAAPLSLREAWICDGRDVPRFRPTLWDRWSQRLEITSGELLPGSAPAAALGAAFRAAVAPLGVEPSGGAHALGRETPARLAGLSAAVAPPR